MKPIEKFIEGMKSADNSAYTLKQLITKLSLITKDIATDTETVSKVIKISSSTDVTSMFDQVKVGDMINHGDTRLYIIAAMNDNDDGTDLSAFVIDYTNDCFGYWYYEKQENNWIINEDISFTIYKSSLGGGTKLYKHSYLEHNEESDDNITLVLLSHIAEKINTRSKLKQAYNSGDIIFVRYYNEINGFEGIGLIGNYTIVTVDGTELTQAGLSENLLSTDTVTEL